MTECPPSISVGIVGSVGKPKWDKGTPRSDVTMLESDKSDGAAAAFPTDPTIARQCRTQNAVCSQALPDHSDHSEQTRSVSATLRDALRAAFASDTPTDVRGITFSVGEWRDYFEERAAIREHDGGMSRADAEAGALADCMARWRALNPLPVSDGGACVHCGRARPDTPVLARGGHAWLHRECWAAMNAERDEIAHRAVLEALRQMTSMRRFPAGQPRG